MTNDAIFLLFEQTLGTHGMRRFSRTLASACRHLASVVCLGVAVANAQSHAPHSRALPTVFTQEQLLWELELGDHQYTVPRIDGDRLFIGVNDSALEHPAVSSTGGGILICLEPETGRRIWQLPIPRNMHGTTPPFHFNHWKCGVCSRPAVEGNRLYIVGPRGDVLCLDRDGQGNGNDGPFLDEKSYMGIDADSSYQLTNDDGDIVWQYDLLEPLGVVPHDVCGSSPVIQGDYLYACTSNGVDHTHNAVANPDAPSLIALDKRTGQLAAVDAAGIGQRMFHGQWSSPVAAEFHGRPVILFGGGDGILYAFEPLQSPANRGQVETLKIVWQYDCCPAEYRQHDGQVIPYSRWNRNSPEGPSEVIAIPTVWEGLVFVTIGQSPVHGAGRGILSCIDGATGTKVWDSRDVDRTLSDVVIHEGLLYVADYSGQFHCFDARSGQRLWYHDLKGGVWCATPAIVGDKIYIGNEKNRLWVLRTGREKQVVAPPGHTRSVSITPVLAGKMLLFPTQNRLFALRVE